MPRQIEEDLIEAIRAGRPFDKRHHAYEPMARIVRLYGNAIVDLGRGEPGVALWASMGGYNTPRTRQTINAVCKALTGRAPLLVQDYIPHVDGKRVSASEWWPVVDYRNARQSTQRPAGDPGAGEA
jgi:hypothetical protein